MAGLRVYRELLGNRPMLRLLLGEFVSGIGDWLYIVAIFVVIYTESGDAALVGAFGGIRLLPYVLLSLPAGIVADRFDRRLVLLVSDLFRGALMVVMAILVATGGSTLLVAGLAILAAGGSSFFYPAMGAYLPALAKDERQLGPANSAWATIQNVSYIAGPAIGGLILALGGVTVAFVINAFTFLFIAVILWTLPSSRAGARKAEAAADAGSDENANAEATPVAATDLPAPKEPTAGGALRQKARPLLGLSLVQLVSGFVGGGFQVITVILAIDVLKAGEEANGYLNAAIGIGGLLGAILAGAFVLRRGLGVPMFIGSAIGAVGTIALGLTSDLLVALVAIGVASAGGLIIDVLSETIFQRLVPDEMRGRGIGVLMTVTTLTGAAGAFILPVMLSTLGPFQALGALAAAEFVLTLAGIVLIGVAANRAPTPYEELIGGILRLRLFTGVPRPRLETALHRVVEVPAKAGDVIIRQGEQADRFYIIRSGSFTVTQTASPDAPSVTLRQLGPDQVFGELGLLYQMPRTATVVADTDGQLLALERDDFLELVGVGGPLRGRLLGLYAGAGVSR